MSSCSSSSSGPCLLIDLIFGGSAEGVTESRDTNGTISRDFRAEYHEGMFCSMLSRSERYSRVGIFCYLCFKAPVRVGNEFPVMAFTHGQQLVLRQAHRLHADRGCILRTVVDFLDGAPEYEENRTVIPVSGGRQET